MANGLSNIKYDQLPVRHVNIAKDVTKWEYLDPDSLCLWYNRKTKVVPITKVEIFFHSVWIAFEDFRKRIIEALTTDHRFMDSFE